MSPNHATGARSAKVPAASIPPCYRPCMHPSSFRASRAACLALLFLSITAASWAGPRWIQATPFGASMQALAQAPSAPRIVYAAEIYGRFFASVDGGATWRRRTRLPGNGIAEMFVDRQEPLTVYARTNSSGLQQTRDGGVGWMPIGSALAAVLEIVPDPAAPHALYAATVAGLYHSSDGGDTWSLAGLDGLRVLSVAIDPRDSSRFLAAIGDPWLPMVWKSADHGQTWVETPSWIDPGPSNVTAVRFAFDPARADTIYLFFPPPSLIFTRSRRRRFAAPTAAHPGSFSPR